MQYNITYVASGYNTDNHLPQAGAIPDEPTRGSCQRPRLGEANYVGDMEGHMRIWKHATDRLKLSSTRAQKIRQKSGNGL